MEWGGNHLFDYLHPIAEDMFHTPRAVADAVTRPVANIPLPRDRCTVFHSISLRKGPPRTQPLLSLAEKRILHLLSIDANFPLSTWITILSGRSAASQDNPCQYMDACTHRALHRASAALRGIGDQAGSMLRVQDSRDADGKERLIVSQIPAPNAVSLIKNIKRYRRVLF